MIVDATVVVSHLVPQEAGHEASRRWLARRVAAGGLVIAPSLLLAEVAGAIARGTRSPRWARRPGRDGARRWLRVPLVTRDVERCGRAARVVTVLVLVPER